MSDVRIVPSGSPRSLGKEGRKPSSALTSGPANMCFVYRPGSGLAGPTVFDSWIALIAALEALRTRNNNAGCYSIRIDDSIVSPAPIPPGTYNMREVSLTGHVLGPTSVTISEGVIFQKLRVLMTNLSIVFTGATPPVADFDAAPFEVFAMNGGVSIMCTGTGPFIRDSSTAGPVVITLSDGSRAEGSMLLFGGTQVIDVAVAAPATSLQVIGFGGSQLSTDVLSGVAGALAQLSWLASSANLSEDQATFTSAGGIVQVGNTTVERRFPTDVITADQSLQPNVVARVDSTGGIVAVTLPPAFNNRGVTVIVKDVGAASGLNPIAILPFAGDTVDEGPMGSAITSPKGSLTFVSDGVNDWMITAIYP